MKTLVIDSHKGIEGETPQNLHWQNARQIADALKADLIWSYPSVNNSIKEGYDRIVFVHASRYSFVDRAWLESSPDAKLFYVTNEYNLGEPYILWKVAKAGRKYTVIANHPPEISKVVKKYTKGWNTLNLNALVSGPLSYQGFKSKQCVYYGSFRKGRIPSFKAYLNGSVVVSTHSSNREKFRAIGVKGPFVDRIDWGHRGLSVFDSSLYLEDEITHTKYNYLANRFYEAINYSVPTLFGSECRATVEKSGWEIPPEYFIESNRQALPRGLPVPERWRDQALSEKAAALEHIKQIVLQQ